MKILKRQKTLPVIAMLTIVCLVGLYAWKSHQKTDYPKNVLELRQKYEGKQESWTKQDTQNCLDDYYRIYPDAKNPKKDVITLAPPCPGVPQ
jgi:hypothetical protein